MRRPKVSDDVGKHISAARAFHTGLIADTHRLQFSLEQMVPHLEVLRRRASATGEKLSAAETSYRHLETLRKNAAVWRETYRDLLSSVRRVRARLRRLEKA
jgi:hypothetical protein